MKKIILYNTLSRKKEEFKPLKKGRVGIYHCGPTVYWTQHIGNLRGSFCTDAVVRIFSYLDYRVSLVRNYTDVGHLSSDNDEGDDKMEKSAKREGLKPAEIAQKYIDLYENDTRELNILEPKYKPKATQYIDEMIKMTAELLDKGYAYTTDLAIYFDISKAKDYNKLSRQNIEKNISGAGSGDVTDSQKKNKEDFVLWFFRAGVHKNALQYWESPFNSALVKEGIGFPGWHIECSAMSRKCLGKTIDVHMGGIEHVPVHHTNEIAQSESANGKTFSNYWLHNEHLLVNNGKMSKSEGTSYSLSDIKEKGFSPFALRYFYLQAHYRSKQNFTWESLESASIGYKRLLNSVIKLGEKKGRINAEYKNLFEQAISDDFNTPKAMAVVQAVLKSDISEGEKLATVIDFDKVLGLGLGERKDLEIYPDDVLSIFKQREEARKNKDWEASDRLRDDLRDIGYLVEDGNEDSILKKI
ncbi:MAG: cysteine--tRNA ligase [Patescibacteria group bacterium]|jgi:cysteinyl-tRNA synthetase|nr:cysteine--tRNA ligase [Patescibacteria group bacterium]